MPSAKNNLAFITCSYVTSITPNGDLSVSAGQPYSLPIVCLPPIGDMSTIDFSCGRHHTADVALAFNSWSGNTSGNEYGLDTMGDSTPGALNFAFGIECTFTISGNTGNVVLYLGQGFTGLEMNWWMGSTSISNSETLTVNDSNGNFLASFTIGPDDNKPSNGFILTINP